MGMMAMGPIMKTAVATCRMLSEGPRGFPLLKGCLLGGCGDGVDEFAVDEVDDAVHPGQVHQVVGDEQS